MTERLNWTDPPWWVSVEGNNCLLFPVVSKVEVFYWERGPVLVPSALNCAQFIILWDGSPLSSERNKLTEANICRGSHLKNSHFPGWALLETEGCSSKGSEVITYLHCYVKKLYKKFSSPLRSLRDTKRLEEMKWLWITKSLTEFPSWSALGLSPPLEATSTHYPSVPYLQCPFLHVPGNGKDRGVLRSCPWHFLCLKALNWGVSVMCTWLLQPRRRRLILLKDGLIAMWLWESYSVLLSHTFLICIMETKIIAVSQCVLRIQWDTACNILNLEPGTWLTLNNCSCYDC